MTTQLDLFRRPPATLLLFPLHRRMKFVRAVAARILEIRARAKKQKYWDDLIASLSREMLKAGCSKASIDDDLTRFWAAVNGELSKQRIRPKTHADGSV